MKLFTKSNIFYLLCGAAAVFFFLLYSYSFRNHPIGTNLWSNCPMNLEGQDYEKMAKGEYPFLAPHSWKTVRHPLCAITYPVIYASLTVAFPIQGSPLVSSFLGAVSIAVFGFWLYRKTRRIYIVLPIVFLLGFNFSVWYVSSIWESRALILFFSVLILISLDGLLENPTFGKILLVSAATVGMLLAGLANVYNLVLVPFALLLLFWRRQSAKPPGGHGDIPGGGGRSGRDISAPRAILFSCGYIGITLAVTVLLYQILSLFAPRLDLIKGTGGVIPHTKGQLTRSDGVDWSRFKDFEQIKTGVFESMLYSVGGLNLPGDVEIYDPIGILRLGVIRLGRNQWQEPRAFYQYARHWPGRLFVSGYVILLLTVGVTIFVKNLWLREPLIPVIIFWIIVTTAFLLYVNSRTTTVFSIELQPGIWALFALTLAKTRKKIIPVFLSAFTFVVAWNNYGVIDFFRNEYSELALYPIRTRFNLEEFQGRNLISSKNASVRSPSGNLNRTIYRIIDNDPETYWQMVSDQGEENNWIVVDFGDGSAGRAKFIAARPRLDRPQEFFPAARLWRRDDGVDWELITEIRSDYPPGDNGWRLWPISNDRSSRYYGISFYDKCFGKKAVAPVSIAEIGLY